jgi:hypothetical protein
VTVEIDWLCDNPFALEVDFFEVGGLEVALFKI